MPHSNFFRGPIPEHPTPASLNKKVIYKRATSLMGWAQCALGHIPEHPANAFRSELYSLCIE